MQLARASRLVFGSELIGYGGTLTSIARNVDRPQPTTKNGKSKSTPGIASRSEARSTIALPLDGDDGKKTCLNIFGAIAR